MRFGLYLLNYGVHASTDSLLVIARTAEELGFYSIWVAERLIVPIPPNQPWSKIDTTAHDPIVTLAFLASTTEKVKVGTNILVAPFRQPLVLAKQTATLDLFSQGRLILGLGVGWMPEEFKALGIPMKQRGVRTDEIIHLLRELWEKPTPCFQGKFTQFPKIHFEPKPAQRIPIWIGGASDAALRRVAELGDGWSPGGYTTGLSLEQLTDRIYFLKGEAEKRQRPLDQIVLSHNGPFFGAHDTARMKRDLEIFRNLGISHFCPDFVYETTDELLDQMRIFSRAIINSS